MSGSEMSSLSAVESLLIGLTMKFHVVKVKMLRN